jgi:membrane protease subunit HflC
MQKPLRNKLLLSLLAAALLVAFSSVFIVNQTQTAIVLQFKKPMRIIKVPGLNFKAPWEDVAYFDNRLQDYNAAAKTIIAGDLKRLEVDAYVKYRIAKPLKFLQTVRSESNLVANLDPILESSMRKVISEKPLNTLLTDQRDEIMGEIRTLVNTKGQDYGIDVVDVRIMRADFPEKNRNDIYLRMRSEREREAKDLRAKGAEEATKIQAQADRQRTQVLSEAQAKAEEIKGEGDGGASKIYAEAFGQDPEFYRFYRSMAAYRDSIKKGDTSLVLSPNSEFLKYLK